MFIPVSFLLVSLTSLITITSTPSLFIDAFSIEVTQQQQRKQQWQQQSLKTAPISTSLHVVPIDIDIFTTITAATSATALTTTTTVSVDALHAGAQTLLLATIDSDIANIQLEEFRKVFAGGIAVMAGGLMSTIAVGVILEKNNLYTKLAAESYLDMANDDPDFWKKMTEGLSEEEQAKTREIMQKMKQQKEGKRESENESENRSGSVVLDNNNNNKQQDQVVSSSQGEAEANSEKETAKVSNDMFSDY